MTSDTYIDFLNDILKDRKLSNIGKLYYINKLEARRWSESTNSMFTKSDQELINQYARDLGR